MEVGEVNVCGCCCLKAKFNIAACIDAHVRDGPSSASRCRSLTITSVLNVFALTQLATFDYGAGLGVKRASPKAMGAITPREADLELSITLRLITLL